jgi:hypothetical protein
LIEIDLYSFPSIRMQSKQPNRREIKKMYRNDSAKSFWLTIALASFSIHASAQTPQPVFAENPVLATPTPVMIQIGVSFGVSSVAPKSNYTVPPGQRLTIDHISASCKSWYTVVQEFDLRFGTGADTAFTYLIVPLKVYDVEQGLITVGLAAQPVHAILDSGTVLWVDGQRSTQFGLSSCNVTVTGYVTPQPQVLTVFPK